MIWIVVSRKISKRGRDINSRTLYTSKTIDVTTYVACRTSGTPAVPIQPGATSFAPVLWIVAPLVINKIATAE